MKKLYFLALSLITMSLFSENLSDDEFNQATNKHCVEVAENQDRVGGPPLPPKGKRWVRNEKFSDEFNGTELDTTKWYNYHPKWKGRPPALFMPSSVTVSDGYLKIRNQKMDKDTIVDGKVFNIAGGAVRSKSDEAFYGYYECKFKASKTYMSTTFWLSSNYQRPGPKGGDRYGLELDIAETIGEHDSISKWAGTFHQGMGSNAHYWYTSSDGVKHDHNNAYKFKSDVNNSDVFNVYAAWWKDATQAELFFNNNEGHILKFDTTVTDTPFDYPMAMNMVTETYSWIQLPTDEQLNNDAKNTSYYDWVRSYMLVDADDPYEEFKAAPIVEQYVEDVAIDKSDAPTIVGQNIHIPFTYRANDNREIHFTLRNSKGEIVATDVLTAYAGYANTDHSFELDEKHGALKNFTLHADIRPIGGGENEIINSDVHKCTE